MVLLHVSKVHTKLLNRGNEKPIQEPAALHMDLNASGYSDLRLSQCSVFCGFDANRNYRFRCSGSRE